jgi:hypothetical protein
MNKIITLSLAAIATASTLVGQTQVTNGGFENWGNASPGVSTEPTNWYSNKSGSTLAKLGPQTCFQDQTVFHSGTSSVRMETTSQNLGFTTVIVNGSTTTGVVNAPTSTKSDGYIGTANYSTASDSLRRMAFTGRPDSLVGWYQYTAGGSAEKAKVRAILHVNNYFDPETPTTYHSDPTAHKIADALFVSTAGANVAVWTRFSVPFTYVSANNPTYIMINATSSDDQNTTVAGSKFWLDDLTMIYNPSSSGISTNVAKANNIHVFYSDKNLNVDFSVRTDEQSTLSIYDLTGKLVASQKIDNNKLNTVNVSTLNTGLYLYLISGTASQKAGKFIVD